MVFVPSFKKISIFRISYRKSFLGSKNVAFQFLKSLGSLAPVSCGPVSYKKTCSFWNVLDINLKSILEIHIKWSTIQILGMDTEMKGLEEFDDLQVDIAEIGLYWLGEFRSLYTNVWCCVIYQQFPST